jgi:hypothetical protein
VSAAVEHAGGGAPVTVRPAPGPEDTTRVLFADPTLAESQYRTLFVDPGTGEIRGDLPTYGSTDVRFKFAPDLSPIGAAGTVIVSDGVDSKTVNVALHWEGGTLTSTKTKTVNTSPSTTTTFQGMDNFRTDMLVSGSIVLNGVELLSPANAVDFSGTWGFAYNSKGSSIEIVRNL